MTKKLSRDPRSGVSNLFEPRAILTYRKYWWTKQTKHPTFCPKIIVISKKKRSLPEISLRFPTFCPEIIVMFKTRKKGSSHQICLQLLPKLTGQRASKNTAWATQNLYTGQMWPTNHGLDAPVLDVLFKKKVFT